MGNLQNAKKIKEFSKALIKMLLTDDVTFSQTVLYINFECNYFTKITNITGKKTREK